MHFYSIHFLCYTQKTANSFLAVGFSFPINLNINNYFLCVISSFTVRSYQICCCCCCCSCSCWCVCVVVVVVVVVDGGVCVDLFS